MGKHAAQTPDGSFEFTYRWYRAFLEGIMDAGYDIRKFSDDGGPGDVILRHDVDLSLDDALRMALVEADLDVQSTYCILLTSGLYNPLEGDQRRRIRVIETLGHEVALHFSTHEYWDSHDPPSSGELVQRVEDELSILDTIRTNRTETVSFHSPPSWVLDRSFDGIRSAYAPEYFSDITYVADSGQRWREAEPDIAEFGEMAQVLTHPGLWNEGDDDFEGRIERSIKEACRHSTRKARREFLQEEAR